MTNISGWVTFKAIVDSVQLAWGDSSDQGQFMRLLNFAIKGYTELRLRHLPATCPVILPIQGEMRVVVLPRDCLKFVSVGIVKDGRFHPFLPKSDNNVIAAADCGIETRETHGGWFYTLDIENRRIIIDCPLNFTEVTLNYTPTGVKMDGMTYIPRMAAEFVEAYVEHQWSKRDKQFDAQQRIDMEKGYIVALNKFRSLQFNTDEIFNEYYLHIATGKHY